MMERLRVQLVSPAMIGGADPRKCDEPLSLRVPELRGLFRFWTRALGGARFRDLEERLWGSTRIGQRVTVRTINVGKPPSLRHPDPFLFPHKSGRERTPTQMIAPNPEFEIRFGVPHVGGDFREQLQAVVWTALHLGAVGRRSRRGYGSLQWIPTPGDLLSGFLETTFDAAVDLLSESALRDYILRGLTRVAAVLGRPTCGAAAPPRSSSEWFQLLTIDQVFVGRALNATYDGAAGGMEELIHGCGTETAPSAEDRQLGTITGMRLASPMLWHVYRLASSAYLPVMTWSPREAVTKLSSGSGIYAYLTGTLGFSLSLSGQPL